MENQRKFHNWGFINNRVDFWISSWYYQLQQNLQSVNSKVQSNLFLPAGLLHRIDWFMDKGEMTGEKLKWLANSEPWIKLQFSAFRAKGWPHSITFIIRRTPGKVIPTGKQAMQIRKQAWSGNERNQKKTKQQKHFGSCWILQTLLWPAAHKLLSHYQPQTAFHLNLLRWKQSFMNLKCRLGVGLDVFGECLDILISF